MAHIIKLILQSSFHARRRTRATGPACRFLLFTLTTLLASACGGAGASSPYFGTTDPPEGQQLRYISGAEPESLDPQIGSAQSELRLFMALYEGLTEYDPRSSVEIPALAERWEAADANTTFVFHLRRGARWSDGSPITAGDFVYTVRRGLAPALASRMAYMSYDILYAQAFNEGAAFVRDTATGEFLVDDTPSRRRLIVPGRAEDRAALDARLRQRIHGAQVVPVRVEDIGVEAVDDHTIRIRTVTPVPFMPRLLSHQFFRLVPQRVIERYGDDWTRPGHIVTSGAFTLETRKPYDRIVVVRNPLYWDTASVRLERITFYPMDDLTTMMNLYKAGEVDAVYNHVVPVPWLDQIGGLRDYMNGPEALAEFYWFNVERGPTRDVRVRKAFSLAIDRAALADFKRTVLPLKGVVPEGLFPSYPHPQGVVFDPKRARALLAEAGYRDARGEFDASTFPVDDVELTYNTSETLRQTAEFVQSQWKTHLGLTIPIRNMEFRTLLSVRARREYRGIVRGGWVGDYLDPFSFLNLFSTTGGENGSGWFDPRFLDMLVQANRETDAQRRYERLARAEAYLLDAQPILPLYTTSTDWMKKPYVTGMYDNPLMAHPWKFVAIEHDPARWEAPTGTGSEQARR